MCAVPHHRSEPAIQWVMGTRRSSAFSRKDLRATGSPRVALSAGLSIYLDVLALSLRIFSNGEVGVSQHSQSGCTCDDLVFRDPLVAKNAVASLAED